MRRTLARDRNAANDPYGQTLPRGTEELGTLSGAKSAGVGIAQSGKIVGVSETAAGTTEAFLWARVRGMRSLGALHGSFSLAFSVNTHRRVVG